VGADTTNAPASTATPASGAGGQAGHDRRGELAPPLKQRGEPPVPGGRAAEGGRLASGRPAAPPRPPVGGRPGPADRPVRAHDRRPGPQPGRARRRPPAERGGEREPAQAGAEGDAAPDAGGGGAAAGDRLASLWTLAGQAGCREGELLGLKWADVEWERATVTIQRTLVRVRDGVPEFADPKTEAGRRTLPLPRTALAALRDHRDRQGFERRRLGEDYTDLDLVFASHTGTPLLARNVVRAFKALLARAGLPRTDRVHDLRHSAATALLASGTDLATTSRILGHASPQVTATVYAHVLPRATAEAMARLEDAYARAERAARG
jgi:integrase